MQKALSLEIVQQITDWSLINSGSWNAVGLHRMADALTEAFAPLGGVLERRPVQAYSQLDLMGNRQAFPQANVISIRKRPEAPLQILFVGHMDTVYDPLSPFQTVWQTGDALHGPGVADMKGGLSLILWALKQWETMPQAQQMGWQVIITPDEEIGSHGSMPYLLECAAQHHVGLVFEPAIDAEGNLASTRKGSGKFTVMAKGKSAHVGRAFHEGENAIVGLAHLIPRIHALNAEQSDVIVNVGQVRGGEAVNAVPALAGCKLDVRISSPHDGHWFQSRLSTLVAEQQKHTACQFNWEGAFTRPPKVNSPQFERLCQHLQTAAQRIGQTVQFRPSGGCCDGNNLAQAGLPNLDTLGVCGGHIHSDQEYLLMSRLNERLALILSLLNTLVEHKQELYEHVS